MKNTKLHKIKLVKLAIGNLALMGLFTGCAAMTKSELLDAINRGDQIEIEVAYPEYVEQGVEVSVNWTQLDKLTSQPELRNSLDSIFKIIPQGDSKNGVLYVDLEGKHEGNNTLYNVFSNNTFRNSYWNNESVQEELAKAAADAYADIEFENGQYDVAVLAAINGYFNILNDSEVGYANMDSTVSRLEAMAAIFKAEYPVTDTLTEDADFNAAIGADSSNEYAIFASNLSEQSYLSISSGSLDSHTENGTITRGELAYMLVQKYFADEYNSADTKATCFKDVVNGGDIATAQKFIENGNYKEGWQAYELVHALRNVDEGCPERMYKALVVAYEKGIIADSDCRWDEGVSKVEFLEMLTNTYMALPVSVSAERGTVEGYEVATPDTETEDTSEFDNMTSEEKSDANYNDSQSGDDEEQIFEEEPAEPEAPEVPTEPEQPEVEKPSTGGTPGNYNFSAEERQWMKETWGLSDSEIDSMTKERFHELVYMEYGIDLSGSHSSSGNSGGSSSAGGSTSGGSSTSSDNGGTLEGSDNDLPTASLGNPEDTLPGRM